MKLGTSNCANYSLWNPKRSAKYVYHTGTSASSTARAGTSFEKDKKFVQYTIDLLSIPNYYIKKGRPHGHRYGKKPGDRILHRPFTQEEVQKEELLGYPRPIHTRQKVPQEHD